MAVRVHLTKAVVDALQPRRREFIAWDKKIPGYGMRVRPGGGKAYVLRLRVDGRQRWYRIGHYGKWTPDAARGEALRVLGDAEKVQRLRETGAAPPNLKHPIEARDQHKVAPTVAAFAKRYLKDFAHPHKRPASVAADEGNLRRAILPVLGNLRLNAVTRSEVTRFHLSRQKTPTNANRCLALLSHMMSMAEAWGERPQGSNPCMGVERFKETKRKRYLSPAELARLGAGITALERARKVTPFGLAAVRLLIFTGARASEVLGLTWGAVNVKAGGAFIPNPKEGEPKTLPLNAPAAAVLSKLPRVKDNPYVIVGGRIGAALTLSGLEQVWQEVRKAAQLDGVRLHDLRHSFASVAVGGGASLPVIGALLGHTQAATTQRYAHLAADPLNAASHTVGKALAAAMDGKRPRRTNVATMRRGRR